MHTLSDHHQLWVEKIAIISALVGVMAFGRTIGLGVRTTSLDVIWATFIGISTLAVIGSIWLGTKKTLAAILEPISK